MNWKEIEEKYPKGLQLCNDWLQKNRQICFGGNGWTTYMSDARYFQFRDMYDFFDENNIFIDVSLEIQYTREVDEDDRNPHYIPDGFYYTIHDNRISLASDTEYRKLRSDTEKVAFTKAFEILENKEE